MGVLSGLAEANRGAPGAGLIPGHNPQQNLINVKSSLIESAGRTFEQEYANRWPSLAGMLESNDTAQQYRAATTIHAVEQVKNYIEGMKTMYGESVVTASLGTLVPRVLDIVRFQ